MDAQKVTIQFDGSSAVYNMTGSGKRWAWLADLNAGNPRVLTMTAYDAKGNTAQTTLNITVAAAPKLDTVSAASDKYTMGTNDSAHLTAYTNISASKVVVSFPGTGKTANMSGGGTSWYYDTGAMYTGNRQVDFTAYDATGNTAKTTLYINVTAGATPEPAPAAIAITSAVSDKYEGHTDEKFNITVRTNIAAKLVRIAYDGTSATTEMKSSGDGMTWTCPALMNPGNPRVLTIAAYDSNGKASSAATIRIKVNGGAVITNEPMTEKQRTVIEKAESLVGATTLPIGGNPVNYKCQAFVYQAVYLGLNKASAVDKSAATAKAAMNLWRKSTSMSNIPIGAAVYYDAGIAEGHVGIYVGNGMVIHARANVRKDTLEYMNSTYKYLGWGWQAGYPLN